MKICYHKPISLIIVLLITFSLLPISRIHAETQDHVVSFLLQNRPDGDSTYELNITIPDSLYQYYKGQSHFIFSPAELSKFVTPYTLNPIADRLWQIYNNTEDFTNGVLTLVHQITYEETTPGKYPVETLVAGKGDCDLFAFIAASILKAGGIPVVLLYYKEQAHMEIGVALGSPPEDARNSIYSINFENNSYYIGECTGGKWRQGWRVGECPADYQNASSQVIELVNSEKTSIEQVSANLRELDPSTLSIQVSSLIAFEYTEIAIEGQIHPQVPYENVTLKASVNGGDWNTITTIETNSDGQFLYSWIPPTGTVDIQASWLGNSQLNGATSVQNGVTIISYFYVLLLSTLILGIVLAILIIIIVRRRKIQPAALPSTL